MELGLEALRLAASILHKLLIKSALSGIRSLHVLYSICLDHQYQFVIQYLDNVSLCNTKKRFIARNDVVHERTS